MVEHNMAACKITSGEKSTKMFRYCCIVLSATWKSTKEVIIHLGEGFTNKGLRCMKEIIEGAYANTKLFELCLNK